MHVRAKANFRASMVRPRPRRPDKAASSQHPTRGTGHPRDVRRSLCEEENDPSEENDLTWCVSQQKFALKLWVSDGSCFNDSIGLAFSLSPACPTRSHTHPDQKRGQDRTGQDRRGEDRKGKERRGKEERRGEERRGEERREQNRTEQNRTE